MFFSFHNFDGPAQLAEILNLVGGAVRLSMEGGAADGGGLNQSFENSDGDLSDASDAMLAEPDDQLANATTSESDGESMACVAGEGLDGPARKDPQHRYHRWPHR